MKKNLLLLFSILLPLFSYSETVLIDNIYYDVVKKTRQAEVKRPANKYTFGLTIPESIMYDDVECSVISIADNAFNGCIFMESISLPNTLQSIGSGAFWGCTALLSISLPNNIQTIGEYAFRGCTKLASVNLPDNLESISEDLFYECKSISSIIIPDKVATIGKGAFVRCEKITKIEIPNSVTSIGSAAFLQCTRLRSITISNRLNYIGSQTFELCDVLSSVIIHDLESWLNITFADMYANPLQRAHRLFIEEKEVKELIIPENITKIPDYTFFTCNSLTSVAIPKTITSIGKSAFQGCENITSLDLSNAVCSMKESAFSGCDGLTSVFIPHGITLSGNSVFQGCNGLTSVTFDDEITTISNEMFAGCKNLSTIVFPKSLSDIGGSAFSGCSGLASLDFPNSVTSIGSSAFSGCKTLTKIILPKGLISIKNAAFYGCSKLSSIVIPSSVTSIGLSSFAACEELTDVFCYATKIPQTNSEAFEGSYINYATLHVLENLISTYSQIEPWNGFKNIVKIDMPEYALTYQIGDEIYASYKIEEGAAITPEPAPTKEGYTFSGWSEIPETMPDHDVTITGSFSINKYKLTYLVDNLEYKLYEVEYGATITSEPAPTKEGYTFSGWSEIPETMPANDVTVTGSFSINKYKLTYMIDNTEYKSYEIEYGTTITPEPAPTKEGYTFNGWSGMPEAMPANDVTVTGSFSINKYKLTYAVDGEEYKNFEIEYGTTITPETAPIKEGYTFSGWNEIPETMPAHDVTVTGSFIINNYKLTYMIDDKVYKEVDYEYGATIIPEPQPEGGYATFEWIDLPHTMPAHDVVVHASYTSGIIDVLKSRRQDIRIYSTNGKRLDVPQKGVNIIRMSNGTVKKIVVK